MSYNDTVEVLKNAYFNYTLKKEGMQHDF